MTKSVFIKNNRPYQSTFAIKAEADGRGFIKFTKTFDALRVDPVTGRILSTGYTEVSNEEFADLKTLKIFAGYIKDGSFVVFDKAPEDALKDSQIVSSLRKENGELKAKIKELETLLGTGKPSEKEAPAPKKTKKEPEF